MSSTPLVFKPKMACALRRNVVLGLSNTFRNNIRIFNAPMYKGQPHRGVEKTGNILLNDYNLIDKLSATNEFNEVTVHNSYEPEKTLCGNILENTYGMNDMVLSIGGDHLMSFYSIAAHLSRAGPNNLGVIWCDAHVDINTKKTSHTGNKHGMVVSGLMGLETFWGEYIPDKFKLRPENIVYVGTRSIDPPEQNILDTYGIKYYTSEQIKMGGVDEIMHRVLYEDLAHVPLIHLSYDVDVMDPKVFPCTGTTVPGGLSVAESIAINEWLRRDSRFWSMDLVEYNPELGVDKYSVDRCSNICMDTIMKTFTNI
jgi:arginase